MAATRTGVFTSPSRSGSSPMALRSSDTAACTLSTSTAMVASSLPGLSGAGGARAEGSVPVRPDIPVHAPKIAVPLSHIEPVAHHEVGRDGEADVAQVELDALLPLLDQEGAYLDTLGGSGVQVAAQVVQGQAAVDDVLDHQDVPTVEFGVEVLDDPHHPRRPGGAAVRRHGHEVDVDRELDGPTEVAHEQHGALE